MRAVEALLNQTAGRPGEEAKRNDPVSRRAKEIAQNLEEATDEELLAIIAAAELEEQEQRAA